VLAIVLSLLAFLFVFAAVVMVRLDVRDRADLLPGVVRLAYSAFAATCFLVALGAYQRGRTGWWWYVVGGIVPIVQIGFLALWFAKARRAAVPWRRWTL
jgi:hypothetical protein